MNALTKKHLYTMFIHANIQKLVHGGLSWLVTPRESLQ